jgi:hypothetical protein
VAGKLDGLIERPLLMDLAVSLLMILASFFGMLWLLLFWFGEGYASPIFPYAHDPDCPDRNQAGSEEAYPFIPMPGHLRTSNEMVAWMTQELPKLTAEITSPRP